MTTPTVIHQIFYISSGRKNAMYTLRYRRTPSVYFEVDNYICNLSTDPDLAEKKAREYFDAWKARVGETDTFKIHFDGAADFGLFERQYKMSVEQTNALEMLEAGIMPIGKHKGKALSELPAGTVLWYADQVNKDGEGEENEYQQRKSVFFTEVCSHLLGYALEMGYIAKREEQREELAAKKARSQFIGEEKQRLDFEGELVLCKCISTIQVAWNTWQDKYINVIECGDNIVVYFGNPVGEKGDKVKFKATVKEHNERDGVKQTIVQRPKFLEV